MDLSGSGETNTVNTVNTVNTDLISYRDAGWQNFGPRRAEYYIKLVFLPES